MDRNLKLPNNDMIEEKLKSILIDYEIVFNKRFNQNSKKEILTDPVKTTCRFCGKSFPDTTFKKKAHSVPEFMGNKTVFSKYECDVCNELYFSLFENEFANFMLPFNTLSGIKVKKNKIPKYKQYGEPLIEHLSENISISCISESKINQKSENCLEMLLKIPTYIPEYVYRCLVKICIGLIPFENLSIYQGTIDWLMNLNQISSIKPYMSFSTYPNTIQMTDLFTILLARKDDCKKNIPHSIFFLSYGNFAFQTYLPYSSKEILNVALRLFPFEIPTFIDLNPEIRQLRENCLIDLSSIVKNKNESTTVTITGDLIAREL